MWSVLQRWSYWIFEHPQWRIWNDSARGLWRRRSHHLPGGTARHSGDVTRDLVIDSTSPLFHVAKTNCLNMGPSCLIIRPTGPFFYIFAGCNFRLKTEFLCTPSLTHPSVKMVVDGACRDGIHGGSGASPLSLKVLKSLFPHVKLSVKANRAFSCSFSSPYYPLCLGLHVIHSFVQDVTWR